MTMRPEVGDYCEMLEMPHWRFKKPMWARLVESDNDRNYQLVILCGGYGTENIDQVRGSTFYLPHNRSGKEKGERCEYRFYKESQVPDLAWAAISVEVLTEGLHNERKR